MSLVTHPRLPPRRGTAGATWWSKAVLRAVEESAFGIGDLRRGRSLARSGAVGAIGVGVGNAVSAVTDGDDTYTVELSLPTLDEAASMTFVEVVASHSGRIGALLGGQLPHDFIEAVEEAGIELLPYGGELGAACTCDAWLDPCPHALAVWTQLAWLIQSDPFVLTHLRGLPRERVLRDLHAMQVPRDDTPDDLLVAQDAAERAQRMVERLVRGDDLGDV